MNEQLLIDLIGKVDVSLLQDDYIEQDLKSSLKLCTYRRRKQKPSEPFFVTDSFRSTILEQVARNEAVRSPLIRVVSKEKFGEKLETPIQNVKKKVNYLIGIISGIAAMTVLVISVIVLFILKKGAKFAVS